MEDARKLYEELRQVRESLIRVETTITALKDNQGLELRLIRKEIEQERDARTSLEHRVKDIEEDRKYKLRVVWAEVFKYVVIIAGAGIVITKL